MISIISINIIISMFIIIVAPGNLRGLPSAGGLSAGARCCGFVALTSSDFEIVWANLTNMCMINNIHSASRVSRSQILSYPILSYAVLYCAVLN